MLKLKNNYELLDINDDKAQASAQRKRRRGRKKKE